MTESIYLRKKRFSILLLQIIYLFHFAASKNGDKWDYSIIAGNETLRNDSKDLLQIALQSYEEDDIESAETIFNINSTENGISYRLPNTTYPLHYFLHITTNIHRAIFDYNGNCTIEIMVVESTNELVLHAYNLNIFKILIDDLTAQTSMKNLSYKVKNHMLIIFCTENEYDAISIVKTKSFIRNHRLRLEIHYSSVISAEPVGFYQMTYSTKEGDTRIGASTQFEPTYARSALPCYDEPRFKSNFTVRITHGNNYTAVSNMPDDGKPIASHNNMTTTTFLETPQMSVYLLAFVISNFKNTSMHTGNLLQRVFFPPDVDYLNTTNFLDDAIHAIKAFEEIVDIPYVLPKLDHVIVNESYGKGMENWGLITYSNKKFFNFSPTNAQADFDVLEVLTHELVHQWVGNLVTPVWWTYIWLSEGLATYYGHILIDILRPEHKALQYYQLFFCNDGRNDFEESALTRYVESPLSIRSAFNRAAYVKAGCIIQMFEHAFGQQVFRKGLSNYLKTHAFSTVSENDLFDAVQQELVQHYNYLSQNWINNVHDIMYDWTHSTVNPQIKVTRNYGNQSNIIYLEQTPLDDEKHQLFWVPLNFVTSADVNFENTSADFFMPPLSEYSIDLETLGITLRPEDWLLVNKKGTGFYSVLYDNTNMNLISKVLRTDHRTIHVQNRISYFFDLSTYKGLKQSSEDFIVRLECIKYLKNEDNPLVWISAIPLMDVLARELKCDDFAHKLMREFLLNIVMPIYEELNKIPSAELGMKNGTLLDDLEDLVCTLGVDKCLVLKKYFVLKFISGEHNAINETTLQLCNAAKIFNEQEFKMALDYIVGENKLDLWIGLGCTRNEILYQKLLEKIFDMIGDEKNCENKLISYIEFLTIGKLSERKSSWKMLKENMPRILAAPCVDMFFENLSKNLIYIDKSRKEELRYIYELYFKHKGSAGIFNETIIGRNIPKESNNLKIITDVIEWLREELNSHADKHQT